jgi:hypothetical protein
MRRLITAVDVAESLGLTTDPDAVIETIDTPFGPIVFVTVGTMQFALAPHPAETGAVAIVSHAHEDAESALECQQRAVEGGLAAMAEYEAALAERFAASEQAAANIGLYV